MSTAPITRLTAQEALVCAMVLMSVADGPMSDAELGMMARMVQVLPAFCDFHAGEIETVTDAVMKLLGRTDGLDQAMAMLRDSLPMRLRETAYLLACEVCAADGEASQEELQFLQMLEDRLELPKLAVAAIEHSARVRYRKPA